MKTALDSLQNNDGMAFILDNTRSDHCDNHDLSGSVCVQGQVGFSVFGGVVFDVFWNSVHFKEGAEVTGMITASVSRCISCNSNGCSLGETQLCLEGDVSAHIYLMYVHINYSLFNAGKCWKF